MSEHEKIGRRDAARRALVVLGAAAFAPSLLAGCGGEDEAGGGALTCTDASGLSSAEIQTRQAQSYVDASPHPDRKCDGCRFYTQPAQPGTCGGCQVLAGPIHPDGYCDLYAAPT